MIAAITGAERAHRLVLPIAAAERIMLLADKLGLGVEFAQRLIPTPQKRA